MYSKRIGTAEAQELVNSGEWAFFGSAVDGRRIYNHTHYYQQSGVAAWTLKEINGATVTNPLAIEYIRQNEEKLTDQEIVEFLGTMIYSQLFSTIKSEFVFMCSLRKNGMDTTHSIERIRRLMDKAKAEPELNFKVA